jgi:hypothetical protein
MARPTLSPRAASPRRWVLCAGLLAGGFVVGGGIGTLLVIGAVCAVLDAVVPIPRSPQAEDRSTEGRWMSLWMAQARGLDLPPVADYRIGERHVLRDGHHRVSVALDHGRDEIEADVVELRTSRPTSSSPRRLTAR